MLLWSYVPEACHLFINNVQNVSDSVLQTLDAIPLLCGLVATTGRTGTWRVPGSRRVSTRAGGEHKQSPGLPAQLRCSGPDSSQSAGQKRNAEVSAASFVYRSIT